MKMEYKRRMKTCGNGGTIQVFVFILLLRNALWINYIVCAPLKIVPLNIELTKI